MRIKHCMNGTTWTAHVQPWTNAKAVEAASSLKNAATGLVLQATKLAAQADRIMHDL